MVIIIIVLKIIVPRNILSLFTLRRSLILKDLSHKMLTNTFVYLSIYHLSTCERPILINCAIELFALGYDTGRIRGLDDRASEENKMTAVAPVIELLKESRFFARARARERTQTPLPFSPQKNGYRTVNFCSSRLTTSSN